MKKTNKSYLFSSEMEAVRSIQLDLLKKLLLVCEKYDLKIWASSGTLLGAVRERGYIPWDDDIDMEMLRPDYNRLVEVSQKEFTSPYFFQCAYTETSPYPIGHAQLRRDGTTAVVPGMEYWGTHQGIFIDIFVLDNAPVNEQDIKEYSENIKNKNQILRQYCCKRPLNPFKLVAYYHKKANCKNKSYIEAFKEYEAILTSIKESSYFVKSCLKYSDWYLKNRKLKKEYYKNTLYMQFEDLQIPVPACYHEILTVLYGDYMIPVNAPTCHGAYLALSPTCDYKPIIRKLRKKMIWLRFLNRLTGLFRK